MASGVGGWPADCIPAPRPPGLHLKRDQSGRAPWNVGLWRSVRSLHHGLQGRARQSDV